MVRALALACIVLAVPLAARAEFPTKPVRIVIPFAPGGTTDILARAIGKEFSEAWKQPVVGDNRVGANGIIAADIVAKSPGDGYTLLMVAMGQTINPLVYKKLPFDTDKDFTPICLVATFPQWVMVNPTVPAHSLKEFIELAKSGPRPMTYGSGGNGSSQHLAGALLGHMAGIKMDHVPYNGGTPAMMDVIAGNVNMIVIQPTSTTYVTSGKLRALAVSSKHRLADFPDIPTVSEAGVPGYESVAWYGIIGPKNLPPDVLKKISDTMQDVLKSNAVRQQIANQGGEVAGGSPEDFASFMLKERERYEPVVREAGITAN